MKLSDWIELLCLVIALAILWQFRQILLLLFTATVIAIALNSLVRWLVGKFRLKRGKAILLSLVLVVLAGSLFSSFIVPPFVNQFQQLLELVPVGFQEFLEWFNQFTENPPAWFPQPKIEILPEFSELTKQFGSLVTGVFGNFFAFFSNTVAILLQLLLMFVLALMFLGEPLAYRGVLLRLFPSSYRRRADGILNKCETTLLAWLRGVSLSSLFVALMSGLGLLLLGIPLILAHALLAGIFNFIPNIGPTLSAVFPIAVALLNSPGKAFAVLIWYVIVQNLESYWFTPRVMKQQVSLLPAATLIAQLFFATFLGPLGLILALPLAVVAKVWLEEAFIKDILDKR